MEDTETFALIFGYKPSLENTKRAVSENKVLSGNSSGNVIVKLRRMTITEIMSQILPP